MSMFSLFGGRLTLVGSRGVASPARTGFALVVYDSGLDGRRRELKGKRVR